MKRIKGIGTSNLLFYISWFIFLASYFLLQQSEIMYMYDVADIYKVIKVVFILILALKMTIVDKYDLKKCILYFVVLGLLFLNSTNVESDMVFFTVLVAFSAHKIDFDKFLKYDIKIRIFFIALIIFLCLIGALPNFTREINGTFKQSFGFSHPNVLCLNVVTVLLEYMYLNKKNSFKYIIINVIATLLLMHFCNARTSIYAYIIIFILNLIIRNKEKVFSNKLIKICMCILPIMMLGLSFYFVEQYKYGNQTIIKLDEIVTTRISNGYSFYNDYGITAFGSKIETVGTRKAELTGAKVRILDMGYLRLAINNGIVVCLIFVLLLCANQFLIYKQKNYKLLLFSLFFIIIGLFETNIYNIAFNVCLIQFINLFSKKNERTE
jgi:hypothetical protein